MYWPVLRWLGKAWLENDYYNHGFFLFVLSLLLAWFTIRRPVPRGADYQGRWPPAVLIFALSLYVIGFVISSSFTLSISLLFFVFAVCLQFLGRERARRLAFPIFILVLAIPVPSFDEFGILMQDWSASGAGGLASFLGMDVSSSGNDITIGGETYQVAPACSGLNRVLPLVSLSAFMAYILTGPVWKRALLVVLAFPVAMMSNIIRILVTMAVGSAWGADVALDFFHDFSGVVLFVMAVGFIILAAYQLRILHLRMEVFN